MYFEIVLRTIPLQYKCHLSRFRVRKLIVYSTTAFLSTASENDFGHLNIPFHHPKTIINIIKTTKNELREKY